jgi:2-oxoisovalerate dehydrogenase E1 component alpha subunit
MSVTDFVQLLTPEGERVHHPEYSYEPTGDEAGGFYRDMMLTRRIDLEAVALQRQGELGLWVPLLGQEAAQIGAARALAADDFVFPSYREHGIAWCRGIGPADLMKQWRGTEHGGWDPAAHNMANYVIVIGTQTLHAVGYAMGMQRDGAEQAVLACFGDGATSQGDVNEAFVWAAAQNAPVVFFCQNNQWAISAPAATQARSPIYRRADGFGFPGVRVDGNDVLACRAVAQVALERARHGGGPTLIEAYTYRMGAHTTSDDPGRYREDAETQEWKLKDPIERVRAYLTKNELVDGGFFDGIDAEADELGRRVRSECKGLREPEPLEMFEKVYAGPHALLDEERLQYAAYLDSFNDSL